MKLSANKIVSRKGHRGSKRILLGIGNSLPRVHYKNVGEKFLVCFKATHGKDKVIATVNDPRSAKSICNIINELRSKVAELEKVSV